MDKRKVAVIGAGVIGAGVLIYSQKGKEGAVGTMGNIIAAPIDQFSGAEDTGIGDSKKSAAEQIGDIFSMLPEIPMDTGSGMPAQQFMPTGNRFDDAFTPAPTKKTSMVGMLSGPTIIGAQAGAYSVMKPVQTLGGGAASVADRLIKYPMSPRIRRRVEGQQRARTRKYARTSHAVSMVTGGATRRAPVTKKQQAARKKYPTIYKAWKKTFSWLGA